MKHCKLALLLFTATWFDICCHIVFTLYGIMHPSIEEGLISSLLQFLYIWRDMEATAGSHAWNCWTQITFPVSTCTTTVFQTVFFQSNNLRVQSARGLFGKEYFVVFLWDLKCFSSDHGGAPAQTMCTAPNQCYRRFLMDMTTSFDVFSVQGQVTTVLEKWFTQVTKGINKSFNIPLECDLWIMRRFIVRS